MRFSQNREILSAPRPPGTQLDWESEDGKRLIDKYMSVLKRKARPIRRLAARRVSCAGRGILRLALPTLTLWLGMAGAIARLTAQSDSRNGQQTTVTEGAEQAATMLDLEHSVSRGLAPGETHTYNITLSAGRY